ncbi:hypothetical protein TNCV_3377231 [Trichonephila clavipes]|nr:hypothetical protein TNCV_3377231 [Trichonephila clavipes]
MSKSVDKVDKIIKKLIKIGTQSNHRSLFVILGPQGSKQVPIFSQLLKQYKLKDISTLWCTKEAADVFEVNNKTNLVVRKDASNDSQDDSFLTPYYCSHRTAYNWIIRKKLYQVMLELGIPKKLVTLNRVKCRVKLESEVSDGRLKQGESLSCLICLT